MISLIQSNSAETHAQEKGLCIASPRKRGDHQRLPTQYTFTGQYSHISDDATDLGAAGFGLLFYNARWYDPYLNRFIQPDSIVPLASQGTQALDRYAYTNNNPVRYNDPTGHMIDDGCDTEGCEGEDQTLPSPGVSQDRHERLRAIQEEADLLSLLMQLGTITDLEALARLLDFASILYGDDVNSALSDLGVVVGGLNDTHIIDENDPNEPMGQYYVGYAAFEPDEGTTGFQSTYNPNDDNQVRHFLAGASGAENYGLMGNAVMRALETDPADDALYGQAIVFVNYLGGGAPLSSAGDWVLRFLGQ